MYRQQEARWDGSEQAAAAGVKFAQLKSKGQPPTAVAAGLGENQYGEESRSSRSIGRAKGPAAARRRSILLWGVGVGVGVGAELN